MTTLTDTPPPSQPAYPRGPRMAPPAIAGPRFLPLLTLLFVGSGCAALIYEIVWLQLLQLVIGASAISLGVLLGTFMGGMCLGSLLLSKFVSVNRHPLRVYAVLELLIGACGILVLYLTPVLGGLYGHIAEPGASSVLLRAAISGLCLVPPTLLMGATLPAIARWVQATPSGVSWLGFFYGGNIVGAVFGCLFAGFYLLRLYDMNVTTFVALAINVTVASLAYILSFSAPHIVPTAATATAPADEPIALPSEQGPAGLIYLVIGLSGLSGLGAEVVWTRLLGLMLGATVYTFSIILAVFLLGLGIGSTVGAAIARTSRRPRSALAVCQMLLALAIGWTAYAIGDSLPLWPINNEWAMPTDPWLMFQLDIVRTLWAILPGAILWGASFPLALAAMPGGKGRDTGKMVGRVYAANTLGAILGSLGFAMFVVPYVGSQDAEKVLLVLAFIAATAALLPLFLERSTAPAWAGAGLIIMAIVTVMMGISVPPAPWIAVAFGRTSGSWQFEAFPPLVTEDEMHALVYVNSHLRAPVELKDGKVSFMVDKVRNFPPIQPQDMPAANAWLAGNQEHLKSALLKKQAMGYLPTSLAYREESNLADRYCTFVGEGMNVSVAITYAPSGDPQDPVGTYRYFHGAGKVQASSDPADMRLQRSLGHLSALAFHNGTPENVLVVACGAGVTAGSFVPYDSVKKITICDIEPMVPTTVTPHFSQENYNVVGDTDGKNYDPRTHVVFDDGRHFIRTSKEKFDVITSDPIDPWVKGCAALNTVEYYTMCKEHLNPGGIMALWIPLYENSEESAKSCIATFFQVFPNGMIFSNDNSGQGYDAVLFATQDDKPMDLDKMSEYLDTHPKVLKSLRDVGFGSPTPTSPNDSAGKSTIIDLLSTFAGDAPTLTAWTHDAQINEDKNLRLQYLAGMGLNNQIAPEILDRILDHYNYPKNVFTGSAETIADFKLRLMAKRRIPADMQHATEMSTQQQ